MAKKTGAQLDREIAEVLAKPFDAKEAADHVLRPTARFSQLSAGTRFRFPGTAVDHTKLSGSWYRDGATGGRFKTGAGAAVIVLSESRAHATKKSIGTSGRELSKAAKKANDQIYDLIHNKYFQSIPNDELFAIVKSAGFRFDPEEEEFFLVGRDGKASWQLYDEARREVNHMLVLQWHKLDRTGKYEVVAYVS